MGQRQRPANDDGIWKEDHHEQLRTEDWLSLPLSVRPDERRCPEEKRGAEGGIEEDDDGRQNRVKQTVEHLTLSGDAGY
jgi:hypothetical protein